MFVGNYAFEQTIEDLASITSQPCSSKWARISLTVLLFAVQQAYIRIRYKLVGTFFLNFFKNTWPIVRVNCKT